MSVYQRAGSVHHISKLSLYSSKKRATKGKLVYKVVFVFFLFSYVLLFFHVKFSFFRFVMVPNSSLSASNVMLKITQVEYQ